MGDLQRRSAKEISLLVPHASRYTLTGLDSMFISAYSCFTCHQGGQRYPPRPLNTYYLIWFENHIYNINCVSPKLASSFSHSTGGDLASEKLWVAQMVSASATITRLELKAARVAMPVKSLLGHRSILPVSLKFCLTIPFSSQQLAN